MKTLRLVLDHDDLVKIIDGKTISLQVSGLNAAITVRLEPPADWGDVVTAVARHVPEASL